jgi:hypothetical protein
MLEPIRLPLVARLTNAVGQKARELGVPLVPLTPEALKQRARARAGLSDFGENDFEEALDVLCHSAAHDANLSMTGRLALRDQVTGALVTRLRRIDLHKTRPEIFRAPLVPPLIVLGLPRSGTTMLHRLLSLGPDARALYMWELREPIAGPGPDDRRRRAIAQIKLMKKMAPSLDAKHYIDIDEPEECVLLLDSSLRSPSFWMFSPVYSYIEWLKTQDPHGAYRVYREHIQIFQAQTPHQRLTLKAPAHAGCVDALHAAVPEAMMIHTTRDPEPVVASVNSLFYTILSIFTSKLDLERMARINVAVLREATERCIAMRDSLPKDCFTDVSYEDLLKDPIAAVAGIHRHFGLPFDPAFAGRMNEWLTNRPQHGFGTHDYSLEECGIERRWMHEQFRLYYETYRGGMPPG